MRIDRHNYELYILDYFEGNLPENLANAMSEFLKSNPDIENETKELLDAVLISESVEFENKDSLKKNLQTDIPGISKFEQLSIAVLENDILNEEKHHLETILNKDEEKRNIHKLIQKLKFEPDLSIKYPNKLKIKHFNRFSIIRKHKTAFALAASIALLIGFAFYKYLNPTIQNGGSLISHTIPKYNYRSSVAENNTAEILIHHISVVKITDSLPDSTYVRIAEEISPVDLKQIAEIENFDNLSTIAETFTKENSSYSNIYEKGFVPVEEILTNKFKEKVLKQNRNEKVSVISLVNAFGRFTKKVFNKKIEVEKSKTDDGAVLYAIKTETLDLFTKTKAKEKNKTKD